MKMEKVVLTQEQRDCIDFNLANIEAAMHARTNERVRTNARISLDHLRQILDIYHIAGRAGAVTLEEARQADITERPGISSAVW